MIEIWTTLYMEVCGNFLRDRKVYSRNDITNNIKLWNHSRTGIHCKTPDLSKLRVFGCLASLAKRCTLIGYDEVSKAYRCFDPPSQKVIVTKDISFDEASYKGPNVEAPDQNLANIGFFKSIEPEEDIIDEAVPGIIEVPIE